MAATGSASFYEGRDGEARLQRSLKHQAMLDVLFPVGSLLGDFYRGIDLLTATPTQSRLHVEVSRAVGQAIGMGEDLVRQALVREVAQFVACAQLLARHGTTQRQLPIDFEVERNVVEAML